VDTGRAVVQDAGLVRQRVAVREQSQRRLVTRFRRILTVATRVVLRWPARARLRKAMIRLALQRALEAVNRGDLDAAFVHHHPQVETIWDPGLAALASTASLTVAMRAPASERQW
jgi:hypothetical protein